MVSVERRFTHGGILAPYGSDVAAVQERMSASFPNVRILRPSKI